MLWSVLPKLFMKCCKTRIEQGLQACEEMRSNEHVFIAVFIYRSYEKSSENYKKTIAKARKSCII